MTKPIIIDLHVHSIDSNRSGSNISNWDDLAMLKRLQNHYVKVASFTDHDNLFLESYYRRLKIIEEYKIDLVLLPGCEVNLLSLNGNKKGQAILIFKPENDLNKIKTIIYENFSPQNRKWLTYQQTCELFKDFDFMIFPHAGKGQDNMDWIDIKDSQVDGLDSTNLKSTNLKKILKNTEKINKNIPIVAFSDIHDWKKYPFDNSNYQTYIQAEPNFQSIKEILNNSPDLVNYQKNN